MVTITDYVLEDMILALRELAENYAHMCGVALQLVPGEQNLPKDILAIWEQIGDWNPHAA